MGCCRSDPFGLRLCLVDWGLRANGEIRGTQLLKWVGGFPRSGTWSPPIDSRKAPPSQRGEIHQQLCSVSWRSYWSTRWIVRERGDSPTRIDAMTVSPIRQWRETKLHGGPRPLGKTERPPVWNWGELGCSDTGVQTPLLEWHWLRRL